VGPDQRALSKNYLLAAEKAYGMASPLLRARATEGEDFHFISLDTKAEERELRATLAALRKSFTSPTKVAGLKLNLKRAVTTGKNPRSFLGRVRGNAVVPGTWPDPTLDGILPGINAAQLQAPANEITRDLNASYPEPLITSRGSAGGKVRQSFAYQITASLKPRSYVSGPLPPGLKLNNKTGLISGKPTKAGTYSVKVTANTNAGPASRVVAIVVR
jgi:hypothetical protein